MLREAVKNGDKTAIEFAGHVFRDLGMHRTELTPELIELSREDDLKPFHAAILFGLGEVYIYGRMNNRPEITDPIAERMVEALKDESTTQIALSTLYPDANRIEMMGGYGGGGGGMHRFGRFEFRPELLTALRSGNPAIRNEALRILRALGPKAEPAVPELLSLLMKTEDQKQVGEIARLVESITGSDKALVNYLQQEAESEDAERAARAKKLLEKYLKSKAKREEENREQEENANSAEVR